MDLITDSYFIVQTDNIFYLGSKCFLLSKHYIRIIRKNTNKQQQECSVLSYKCFYLKKKRAQTYFTFWSIHKSHFEVFYWFVHHKSVAQYKGQRDKKK